MAKRKSSAAASKNVAMSDEEKVRREFTAEFLADFRADAQYRKNALEDNDFYDGKQLSEEEIRILTDRGQPPVTINRIKPKMDAIFGMQQAMRVDTKAYPAGTREEASQAVSEFFRSVEDDSDFDDHESLAFEDISIPGRAWYKVGKRWDGLKSQHYVTRAFSEDIVPDRKSRKADHSDAKRVHETVWMDLEDAQALFPDNKDKLAVSADERELELGSDPDGKRLRPDQYAAQGKVALSRNDLETFADSKTRRVRIVTTYYRTLSPKRYYYHAKLPNSQPQDLSGLDEKAIETLKVTYPNGQTITQQEKKLHSITFTWNATLEHLKDIRDYDPEAKFPLIMMEGYRERNTSINYGLVRQQKDPQREVNKRRSKHLHLISVNRTIFEKGVFQNEEAAREEIQKPDGWIALLPGGSKNFKIENNLDLSQGHFLLLQQAVQEIDSAGVSRELEGKSGASSGRDFQLRQQQAVQGIRKLISNLRSGRRRVALYLLDEWMHDNPDSGLSKQDVVVEEAPDTLNLQQETFDKLAGLAEKGVLPPQFVDLLIEVSSLDPAMKKKFLERLQQLQAAQMQAVQAQGAGGAAPVA